MARTIAIGLVLLISFIAYGNRVRAQSAAVATTIAAAEREWRATESEGLTDREWLDRLDRAVRLFAEAVRLDSNNQTAQFGLAVTLDRRTHDSDLITNSWANIARTVQVSDRIERVLAISPVYRGDAFILGPWSKLTSVWGNQAEAYFSQHKFDSARWALREGRRRGGFPQWVLEQCSLEFAACDSNAILFVAGTNEIYPMWYLQEIECVRRDITVVTIPLLGFDSYFHMLRQGIVSGDGFLPRPLGRDMGSGFTDSISASTSYSIPRPRPGGIWYMVPPVPFDTLFTAHTSVGTRSWWDFRSDTTVVNVLHANRWRRPVFFGETVHTDQIHALGLDSSLHYEGFARRLIPCHVSRDNFGLFDIDRLEAAIAADSTGITRDAWRASCDANDREAISEAASHLVMHLNAAAYREVASGSAEQVRTILTSLDRNFPPREFTQSYRSVYTDFGSSPEFDPYEALYAYAGMVRYYNELRRILHLPARR